MSDMMDWVYPSFSILISKQMLYLMVKNNFTLMVFFSDAVDIDPPPKEDVFSLHIIFSPVS